MKNENNTKNQMKILAKYIYKTINYSILLIVNACKTWKSNDSDHYFRYRIVDKPIESVLWCHRISKIEISWEGNGKFFNGKFSSKPEK